MTIFNISIGTLEIASILLKKISKGDLVIAKMIESFEIYLNQLKDKEIRKGLEEEEEE